MITHLACIMDGNRRWAQQHGSLPWDGHREGIKSAQRVMEFCLQQKIRYLSLYTFSLENFKRTEKELSFLFTILPHEIKKRLVEDAHAKNVRINFVGDRKLFPQSTHKVIQEIEEQTAHGTALQVNLLFCYGGRQEIMHGVKMAIAKVKKGELGEEELTDDLFESFLWTAGMPKPDLIIRTGGARRLSNFLLFQAAYSELYFFDCFWPELTHSHLAQAISSFEQQQRNFGK